MKIFIPIWLGQLVSLVGSDLTGFALGVWVYQKTGMVTYFAIISLFTALPSIIFSPFAGVLVDRWDKRQTMILSDLGAGFCTIIIVILLTYNNLQIWHIYLMMGINSTFSAFQWPAFIAMSSEIVEKRNISRASGMMQLAQAFSYILAPMLGGILYSIIDLKGVITIDFITCLFALCIFFIVKLEKKEKPSVKEKSFILNDIINGLKYIVDRKGLLGLLFFFFILNFVSASISVLSTPFILSMVSTKTLGLVISISAIGMMIGSIVMSVWSGPKDRIKWIYVFSFIGSICVILAGFIRSIIGFTIVSFIFFLSASIISSSNQTIWQMKVDLNIQGRVFAIRRMFATVSMPIAYISIGPLADNTFEPIFSENGLLADNVGRIIGVGPGRGIACMFVILGVIFLLTVLIGYFYKPMRDLERELSDIMK